MKRAWIAALIAGLAATAFAGYRYQAKTTSWEEGKRKQHVTMVDAWVEGTKARIVFREVGAAAPGVQEGSYLITTNGGQTLYLVNDKDKTYMEWDLNALLGVAGSLMQSGGMINMTFTDPEVEMLEKSNGGKVLGMATTRHKMRTAYGMDMKVLGMKRAYDIETVQEVWTTKEAQDMALGVWLRKNPPSSGNEELDKILNAEVGKIEGLPLKSKAVSTMTQYNRKRTKVRGTTVTNTVMEVVDWREESIPAKTFKIPPDYKQVEMFGGEESGNPFKGLFKKKN